MVKALDNIHRWFFVANADGRDEKRKKRTENHAHSRKDPRIPSPTTRERQTMTPYRSLVLDVQTVQLRSASTAFMRACCCQTNFHCGTISGNGVYAIATNFSNSSESEGQYLLFHSFATTVYMMTNHESHMYVHLLFGKVKAAYRKPNNCARNIVLS